MTRRIAPIALRRPAQPVQQPDPLAPPQLPVSQWAQQALHFHPDPLQAEILDSPARRLILLCSRQFGKSTLAAIKALHFALSRPGATVLCVSPTLRRSTEWLRLVQHFYAILAPPSSAGPSTPAGALPIPAEDSRSRPLDPRHDARSIAFPLPPDNGRGFPLAVRQGLQISPRRQPRASSEISPRRQPRASSEISPRRQPRAAPLDSPRRQARASVSPPLEPRAPSIVLPPPPPELCPSASHPLGFQAPKATAHSLILPNRARILALPGAAHSNRGYSAHLLLFEEAAFIPDAVFTALLPSVAATGGAVWLVSSAGAPSGFFYDIWTRRDLAYVRFQADATRCPRITPQHLEEARLALGELRFRREYLCEFSPEELPIFPAGLLEAALDDSFEPWPAREAA